MPCIRGGLLRDVVSCVRCCCGWIFHVQRTVWTTGRKKLSDNSCPRDIMFSVFLLVAVAEHKILDLPNQLYLADHGSLRETPSEVGCVAGGWGKGRGDLERKNKQSVQAIQDGVGFIQSTLWHHPIGVREHGWPPAGRSRQRIHTPETEKKKSDAIKTGKKRQ